MTPLELGDDALIAAQRLAEWYASSPQMEEDVALANIALDQLGAARLLLSLVGDEDELAYLRDDRQFRNCLLVELPNGDFAVTMAKLLFLSAGGLTVRGLTREMASAFEVIRRGETEKEIIIPIGDQGEKKERKRAIDTIGEAPERIDLTAEAQAGAGYPPKAPTPGPAKRSDPGPLPMD